MMRRYIATYEYTEIVKGKERDFVHETIIEATGPALAYRQAVSHFDALARESGVGWMRVLTSCTVVEAPQGAVAKGGRRVHRDGELEA
jgi:hypothetical protein